MRACPGAATLGKPLIEVSLCIRDLGIGRRHTKAPVCRYFMDTSPVPNGQACKRPAHPRRVSIGAPSASCRIQPCGITRAVDRAQRPEKSYVSYPRHQQDPSRPHRCCPGGRHEPGPGLLCRGGIASGLPTGFREKAGEGKCGEGKCGEGKCGTSEAGAKVSQAEGKCGEGKCGDESFARTDSDDDHLVSLAEFLAVAPTRQVEFDEMDTNGDGYLSEAEVYKYRSNQYTSNGKPVPTELFTRMSQAKD